MVCLSEMQFFSKENTTIYKRFLARRGVKSEPTSSKTHSSIKIHNNNIQMRISPVKFHVSTLKRAREEGKLIWGEAFPHSTSLKAPLGRNFARMSPIKFKTGISPSRMLYLARRGGGWKRAPFSPFVRWFWSSSKFAATRYRPIKIRFVAVVKFEQCAIKIFLARTSGRL